MVRAIQQSYIDNETHKLLVKQQREQEDFEAAQQIQSYYNNNDNPGDSFRSSTGNNTYCCIANRDATAEMPMDSITHYVMRERKWEQYQYQLREEMLDDDGMDGGQGELPCEFKGNNVKNHSNHSPDLDNNHQQPFFNFYRNDSTNRIQTQQTPPQEEKEEQEDREDQKPSSVVHTDKQTVSSRTQSMSSTSIHNNTNTNNTNNSSQPGIQTKPSSHTYVICLTKPKSILLIPCNHLCICKVCAKHKSLRKCPICHKTVQRKREVYW